jgi:hypothetical protein
MKTSELTGAALDWAVAKCMGISVEYGLTDDERFSTNWAQGGPIIEREGIHLLCDDRVLNWTASAVQTYANSRRLVGWRTLAYGPTPLIAAMRCFVASRLGDEVDIPEELT